MNNDSKYGSDMEVEVKPSQETQKFLAEFIEAYHGYPCLWKYSCLDYRNRNVKEHAYEMLAEKMRESDPRANKSTVMRKINALRTAFRREYKKVHRSYCQTRGTNSRLSSKKRYVPTLWYYDLLKFVVEQQDFMEALPGSLINDWTDEQRSPTVLSRVSGNIETYASVGEDGKVISHDAETFMEYLEETPSMQVVKLEASSPTPSRPTTPQAQPESTNAAATTTELNLEINSVYSEKIVDNERNEPTTTTTTTTVALAERPKRVKQRNENNASEKLKPSAKDNDDSSVNAKARVFVADRQLLSTRAKRSISEDVDAASHLDRFGTYIVTKLARSSPRQCIIAEKIIAEVLMRANLGILHENTTLTDVKVASRDEST